MTRNNARKLARYHKFTKFELYSILKEALETYKDDFWSKPNRINPIFDNGSYFNSCRDWVGYVKNKNDNEICAEIISIRVLEIFGEFSKIKLPKKVKSIIQILKSEKPELY